MKHLDIFIYQLLLEKPQSGYSIAKEMEARSGWKPSWGSIYPFLDCLVRDKQVTIKEEGRTKIYTLTTLGRDKAKEKTSKNKEIMNEIADRMQILQAITGEDFSWGIDMFREMGTGKNPFLPLMKSSTELKMEFYRVWKQDLMQKNTNKINKIMLEATNKLKEIR